jgi:hypothetical protein
MRRWIRHTPNASVAVTMITLGGALLFLAVCLAVLFL